MSTVVHGIVLADLHWGATDLDRFSSEIKKTLHVELDSLIQDQQTVGFFAIAGDLFECKEYISSKILYYVCDFLMTLLDKLTELQCPALYMIEGTRNHDSGQPEIVANIINRSRNRGTKIVMITSVTEITDTYFHTLFIPEEYMVDQNEYYQKYFHEGKYYDLIIGHGMIDKIWYAKDARKKADANKVLAAPVFPIETLENYAVKTYFGHVHIHKDYGAVTYVGPLTRWKFGTGEVGYISFRWDCETKTLIDEKFQENPFAPVLPTFVLHVEPEDTIITVSDKLDDIVTLAKEFQAEKFCLIANFHEGNENQLAIRTSLIKKVDTLAKVKLIIEEPQQQTEEERKKELEEQKDKVQYVLDRGMDIHEQVRNFIKVHNGEDLSVEEIVNYMRKEE